MAVVSLDLLKKHVRADDFSADDDVLNHYLEAAQEAVIRATNRTEKELTTLNNETFPAGLKQAILLLAGDWYNQREDTASVQMHAIPNGLQSLIKQWRKLADDDESGNDEV